MTIVEKTTFHCLPASTAAALIRSEPTATVFDVRDMASYQKAHVDGGYEPLAAALAVPVAA